MTDCTCGHTRADHDREGFGLQCIAPSCNCLHYRPTQPRPVAAVTAAPPAPSTDQLIAAGRRSTVKATAALAARINGLITDLAARLDHEKTTETARARIAALEAELAKAKAALRGDTPPPPAHTGTRECPDCDATFATPQGVGAHRAKKHGYRKATA